jgi:phage baseplate assembly protein gpV
MPNGSDNRITPPDVSSGETVKIYRFADTDEYYWCTVFREPSLRKQETVNYSFSNVKGSGAFDRDSSYSMEVSTHDKYIRVHTSNSDGEPYTYDIGIDTSNGKVSIADNIGNSIVLDSPSSSAVVTTNTSITLKSPTVTIEATNVKIKGDMAVDGEITGTKGITVTNAVHGNNI